MKQFLLILTGGTLFFIGLAMAQEWDVFASSLFGGPTATEISLEEDEQAAARATLRQHLSVMRHLYSSRGDARFAERLPAAPEVLAEILADISYLEHHGLYEEHTLMRLDIESTRPLTPEQVEIVTREYWTIRTRRVSDGGDAIPTQSSVLTVRYRLVREGSHWTVRAWNLATEGEAP